MPVSLANVNISLQQFQEISSGKYNAGEIRLTGQNSLGKVNNHISQTGKNRVSLSHEEVLAVKSAFVKACAPAASGRRSFCASAPSLASRRRRGALWTTRSASAA